MRKNAVYEIETCIKAHEGATTPSEIARLTGIHISSVNDVIEVLEKYGVILVSTNGRIKLVEYKK